MVDYFGQGISRNAVPLFFVISGMLAFWNVEAKNDRKAFVKGAAKRFWTLGIPYVIWNCMVTITPLAIYTFTVLVAGFIKKLFPNIYIV